MFIKHNERGHRLTEENPRKVLVSEERVFLEGKIRKRAKMTSKELVRIRRAIVGTFPYVKITYLNRDANSATSVCSDTLRMMDSPVKSRRKVEQKD